MKHRLRTFILGFLLLWLPLQGFATVGMTCCRHSQDKHAAMLAMQQAQQAHQHCGHPPTHDCAHHQDSTSGTSHNPCDDCSYCHLGTAPALLYTAFTLNEEASFAFNFPLDAHFVQIFPEQLQRPPHTFFS